ncbi:hypothetical protein GUJ93_ZPchr0013g35890 [Zizania palustris]|uniref:Uncharacterized protein n=1 Tax=Zizania palustris TaxID=103762 RepID=A0A8J5WSE2_ZIZPA|nr:hypothetical protein GUJ93_ZPchr0013g35890 [Zizania palustris]
MEAPTCCMCGTCGIVGGCTTAFHSVVVAPRSQQVRKRLNMHESTEKRANGPPSRGSSFFGPTKTTINVLLVKRRFRNLLSKLIVPCGDARFSGLGSNNLCRRMFWRGMS